jgi:hypothetical protein
LTALVVILVNPLMMVYLKHIYNWLNYLLEKYILRKKNPGYPVILKLSPYVMFLLQEKSRNSGVSIDIMVNKILKEMIDEIENK